MADTITLIELDHGDSDAARRIIDAFASRTGLTREQSGDVHEFHVEGAEHGIEIVHTLDAIDAAWPQHVGLRDP